MKYITLYIYKLAIIATSFVMVYFATGIASIAQATDLVKAEPIQHESFVSQAHDHLALTLTTISIEPVTAQNNAKNMIAMENSTTNNNQEVTLNKTLLMGE